MGRLAGKARKGLCGSLALGRREFAGDCSLRGVECPEEVDEDARRGTPGIGAVTVEGPASMSSMWVGVDIQALCVSFCGDGMGETGVA